MKQVKVQVVRGSFSRWEKDKKKLVRYSFDDEPRPVITVSLDVYKRYMKKFRRYEEVVADEAEKGKK